MNETMTFSEWYEFNCSGKHPIIDTFNTVHVKIFQCLSYKTDDVIFSGEALLENINRCFGNYNIFKVRNYNGESSYATFEIFLYPPQTKENSD